MKNSRKNGPKHSSEKSEPLELPPAPKTINLKAVEEFFTKNPETLIAMLTLGYAILSGKDSKRPAYLKDMPPINPRTAGPWRGKGSFGHGFGANKVRHK